MLLMSQQRGTYGTNLCCAGGRMHINSTRPSPSPTNYVVRRLHPEPVDVARLAQLVERKALNLVVVGSSPTVGRCFPHVRRKDSTRSAVPDGGYAFYNG